MNACRLYVMDKVTDDRETTSRFSSGAACCSSVERGQLAPSSKLAAGASMMTDQVEAIEDERDWYDDHLDAINRTEDEDHRISVHEAGHAIAARLLGHPLGGATVDPDPNGKYGGLVWGPEHARSKTTHASHFGGDAVADDVPGLCDKLRSVMPKDGEPRADAADVYLHALNRCIELTAAGVAESMLLPGEPVPSISDLEHSIKYAQLVCKSPNAVESFITLAEQMADDLLRPYGYLLIVLSTVLRIRRTLNGEAIDNIIADTVARFELAAERATRRQWRQRIDNAGRFDTLAEITHG
jgi:hypothetical protein